MSVEYLPQPRAHLAVRCHHLNQEIHQEHRSPRRIDALSYLHLYQETHVALRTAEAERHRSSQL